MTQLQDRDEPDLVKAHVRKKLAWLGETGRRCSDYTPDAVAYITRSHLRKGIRLPGLEQVIFTEDQIEAAIRDRREFPKSDAEKALNMAIEMALNNQDEETGEYESTPGGRRLNSRARTGYDTGQIASANGYYRDFDENPKDPLALIHELLDRPEDGGLTSAFYRCLEDEIQDFSERDRAIFRQRQAGSTWKEIQLETGVKIGTAHRRYALCRKRLARALTAWSREVSDKSSRKA